MGRLSTQRLSGQDSHSDYGSVRLDAAAEMENLKEEDDAHVDLRGSSDETLTWELPPSFAEGTRLGSVVALEVPWQLQIQKQKWMSPIAWFLHWVLKEEAIFIILPFLVWLLTPRHALNAVACVSVSEWINGLLKWSIAFPRPFWVFKDVMNPRGTWEGDFSTPSSHTQLITCLMISFCLSWNYEVALWITAVLLCIITGICRVYVGVHYFHDVMGGWILGTGSAVMWHAIGPIPRIMDASLLAQLLMLLALIVLPLAILSMIIACTPGLAPEQQLQYEAQARSKLSKDKLTPKYLKKCHIVTRTLSKYTFPLASLSGGMVALIIDGQYRWLEYWQECHLSDVKWTLIRALCGLVVQLVLFAIAIVLPEYLIEKGAICEIFKYVVVMMSTMWMIMWLHWAAEVGIPRCELNLTNRI